MGGYFGHVCVCVFVCVCVCVLISKFTVFNHYDRPESLSVSLFWIRQKQ